MIHLLKLFNNPLTKMAINKVSSHLSHKAEKTKIIRAAEIEAAKEKDRQIRQGRQRERTPLGRARSPPQQRYSPRDHTRPRSPSGSPPDRYGYDTPRRNYGYGSYNDDMYPYD